MRVVLLNSQKLEPRLVEKCPGQALTGAMETRNTSR